MRFLGFVFLFTNATISNQYIACGVQFVIFGSSGNGKFTEFMLDCPLTCHSECGRFRWAAHASHSYVFACNKNALNFNRLHPIISLIFLLIWWTKINFLTRQTFKVQNWNSWIKMVSQTDVLQKRLFSTTSMPFVYVTITKQQIVFVWMHALCAQPLASCIFMMF